MLISYCVKNMEPFYITTEQFWEWFDRADDTGQGQKQQRIFPDYNFDNQQAGYSKLGGAKRLKTDNKPRSIAETEAAHNADCRYIIMYGRFKPGKKSKVWEADGYLSLVGQMAHICDLHGRLLEEPTVLDDIDLKLVREFGELTIGNTEVQVVEEDKS